MLLRRAHLQLLALSGLFLGLSLPACTVNSTSGTTSGVGGSGNATGDGGSGAIGVGEGGFGATGATGGTGVGGGTGGSGQCVGETGTGQVQAECDDNTKMPIHAAQMLCGAAMDEAPPGIAVCHHAFDIYLPGDAENLFQCLAQISVAQDEACSVDNVGDCVTLVHTEACDTPTVLASCKALVADCATAGDTSLTEDYCNFLLAPFNDTALTDVETCYNNATEGNCKETLDGCWDQVATIP
jgi:hypothetical protein